MLTIEGIFDGKRVELLDSAPFTTTKRVLITFLDDTFFEHETTAPLAAPDPISALRGRAKDSNLTQNKTSSRE